MNGKDVVLGKVVSGVDTLVRLDTTPVDEDYKPYETTVTIINSGSLHTEPFITTTDPAEVRT